MGNMQYAILFKQRPQALRSMTYFPFMTKIILCVQLATLCSSKISQNIGFFHRKPFRGRRVYVPERGAIGMGGGGGGIGQGGKMVPDPC